MLLYIYTHIEACISDFVLFLIFTSFILEIKLYLFSLKGYKC